MTTAERAFVVAAQRLPTLFELEATAYQLMALLEDVDDPEAIADVEAQLALVDQLMLSKQESYVSVIRSLESMAAARKAEADRLRDRAKTAERHAEWLKARLLTHMVSTNRPRIETSRFSMSIRQNPPSVNVLDAAAVPSEFQRTKIEISVDTRAILETLKQTGEIPPGVEIVRTERLSIA
jgi:metal-sulfur cluster biosynthetic enzyme